MQPFHTLKGLVFVRFVESYNALTRSTRPSIIFKGSTGPCIRSKGGTGPYIPFKGNVLQGPIIIPFKGIAGPCIPFKGTVFLSKGGQGIVLPLKRVQGHVFPSNNQ